MSTTEPITQEPAAAPLVAPAPAASVTPAPAPAAPVPPEPAPPKAEGEVEKYQHEETGNPAIDLALEFIGNVGISPDDEAVAAARAGDFSKIEEKLKGLGDKAKGYDRHLALVKREYESERAAFEAKDKALVELVEAAAGGKERWEKVREWTTAEASAEQKAQINAALQAGGVAAASVVANLAAQFDKVSGKRPENPLRPEAGSASGGDTALTAKEYAKAVEVLARKANGRDISDHPEYRQLQARRLAARRAGVV